MTLFNFAAEHLRRALYLNPPLGARTTSARANDGQAEIRSAASPGVADQGLALSGMAQTTPWAAEGLTLSSREEKLAHYLLSRGKTAQLERLLAKARVGASTGLTSPATGGHAHAATGASRARPLAPHNRPPPRPGKGSQRRPPPPSVAYYAAQCGPEQVPVKVPVTATARAPDPPVLPPPPPRKETPSPPDEASPGETPSPANVTLRRRGRAGPVPPTPQGATPPQAPPTLVREATPPQASPVAATATPPPLREATPPQASPLAPTPVRNATPPAAPAPATVSPIYRDTAIIAADDEACERALTNWLRAPGLAADASAAEWRDAWRVAAAAADVALQKAVQVDQQRMRVAQEYAAFRAGAANLATRAARDCHAELETAKARILVTEASLARYQAAYPPPPVGDEEAASDDAHDGSALPATEAMPRAQPDVAPAEPAAAPHARPDVLAPTPRPGRARLTTVATPAPRPRRYATRSSRRGRAD